ncbi:MAG: hypothetical protein JXB17_09830 [Bacteroidales bacterium]|nr:hypothetical protein [Bacteroidales bacterium]
MKFIDFSENENLTSSYTSCITQDSIGFIWIGTQDGLNRYNGYHIKSYKTFPGDSTSLPHNNIITLYTDRNGDVWIGTNNGLCLYERNYDTFKQIANEKLPSGLSEFTISCINENKNGIIHVSTLQSIYNYDLQNEKFIELIKIDKGEINKFIFDKKNNIWIGTIKEGGLLYYDLENEKIEKYFYDKNNKNSISDNSPMGIALKDSILWIATSGGGINSFNINTKTFKRYPVNDPYQINAKVAYIDNNKRIWTCDYVGLNLYDEKLDIFYSYIPDIDIKYSLKSSILSIFQDIQGNYWTLHSPGGIGLRIVPKGFNNFNEDKFWRPSNNNITAICEDGEGNLWLGNASNGVDIFCWKEKKIMTFNNQPDNKYSIGKGATLALFKDKDDIMWIGSHMGGLQYFDEKTKHFLAYLHDPDNPKSIANNDVRSITEDNHGNLWLVVHGKGIDKFDKEKQIFYHYNYEDNGLSNDWSFQVLHDSQENIWVATVWRLNLLKKGENTFHVFYFDENDTNSLSNDEITSLYEDSKNRIWVGTGDGLNLYNRGKNNFTRFTKGFANSHICAILEDNKNNIWVSTLSGLSVLNSKSKTVKNFDISDDLTSKEYNNRSCYKNNDKLFFGGINGVNYFNPDNIHYNTYIPKVVITNFKLFNEEVTEYNKNSVLKKHISVTEEITLEHKQNIITFEFVAINMIHPEKNQYAYIMEGFDNGWHYVGNKREATYTNLDPGNYVFKVKASNNDDYWNEKGTSIKLTILPPWWKTWWFRIILGIIILILLLTYNLTRTTQLRKQRLTLARQVKKRTTELREKNILLEDQKNDLDHAYKQLIERQERIQEQAEELKQQTENLSKANEELKLLNSTKDKLFSIIAHDLRNPFNSILGFSDILRDSYDELTNEEKLEIVDNINLSSRRVYDLLENLFKWARTQTDKIDYHPVKLSLNTLIKDIIYLLHNISDKKQIEIIFKESVEAEVFADEDMVRTIIRNLLDNAIKYTPRGGKIFVNVENLNDFSKITIQDTGIGMEKDTIENIFNLNHTDSRVGTEGEKGSALGLVLCKEFVERNNGKLNIESKPGQGSIFSFTLPLGKK